MSNDDIVTAVSVSCTAISFVAELFIIFTYLCHSKLHQLRYSLVFYLSTADTIRSFAKLWGSLESNTFFCSLQAFLINYGGLSTFLWVAIIAIVMYTLVFYSHLWQLTNESLRKRKIQMFAICYGIYMICYKVDELLYLFLFYKIQYNKCHFVTLSRVFSKRRF